MQIKSLTLKNFRGFKDTEITFSEGLTVLVGVNGAGKSSVLDALAIMLSWAVARIRTENGKGPRLAETDIHNGTESASAEMQLEYQGSVYAWTLAGTRPGKENGTESDWKSLADFAGTVRHLITSTNEQCSIPVLCYYPVSRIVTSVPVGVPRNSRIFSLLETYDSARAGSANFRAFFEWFRAREDLENEIRMRAYRGTTNIRLRLSAGDSQLESVRKALHNILPGFDEFTVLRDELVLVALKEGKKVRVDQMSDGEKLLIAMTGDIARRLALANPTLKDPLQGEGVVLIDEIEQHLHPAWQRTIIGKLRQTFSNVQFIVSTHSPQVLGEVQHDCIRRIAIGKGGSPVISTPSQSLGLDANLILEELFGAPSRNKEVATELTSIFREIDKEDAKSLAKARREINKLKKKLNGEIPDLVEAEAMLFMLENQ